MTRLDRQKRNWLTLEMGFEKCRLKNGCACYLNQTHGLRITFMDAKLSYGTFQRAVLLAIKNQNRA